MMLGLGFMAILKKVLMACHTNMVALNGLMQHRSAFLKIAIKPKPSIIYTQTFFEYVPYILD